MAALKHEVFWDDETGIRSFGTLRRKERLRGKGLLKLMGGQELPEDLFFILFLCCHHLEDVLHFAPT